MINENNKIPETCIIFALNNFFSCHRDMDTWNDLQALDSNDWDLPNEEDSLAELYEDQPASFIADEVLSLAKQLMDFTINHGGTFETE